MKTPIFISSSLNDLVRYACGISCILLLALGGLSIALPGLAQKDITGKKLSLEEAIEVALHNHPAIKEFKERSLSAKAQIGVSRANLLPQISNTSSYYYGNSVPSSSLNIPSGIGQFVQQPR